MSALQGPVFDPETITLMKTVLEDAWASMTPAQQAVSTRADLAQRILTSAGHGERDPIRLRAAATIAIATSSQDDRQAS